ncbi:MAG TPA: TetR/AcrR family transcriptional regulator [Candidatus Binataceae bacterium]|nr:TetR/AcrR family transcriptional regulator [Candidatus Binataceae bacterium]
MNVKTHTDSTYRRRSKAEQSEITREAIIKAARKLFAARGYANTNTEDLVKKVGLTRGALYHHFGDKEGLFRAVVEDVRREISNQIVATIDQGDEPWDHLRRGCEAFLRACLARDVQRIFVLDCPSVLGWESEKDDECTQLLRSGLEEAVAAGVIQPLPTEALTFLVLGALVQASMAIARAKDQPKALRETIKTVTSMLEGLRVKHSQASE